MRNRLLIFGSLVVVLVVLVMLSAASYEPEETAPESEAYPDRSTYNAGPTGTRALYDLLRESGREVVRWGEKPDTLLGQTGKHKPATFIVVGQTRKQFEEEEAYALLRWVTQGGRLVLIDRMPEGLLLPNSGYWHVTTEVSELPSLTANADEKEDVTAGVAPARPAQPTALTRRVESILPSRYASRVNIFTTEERSTAAAHGGGGIPAAQEDVYEDYEDEGNENSEGRLPPTVVPPEIIPATSNEGSPQGASPAPVAHINGARGALLVDYPYGAGHIILLSDPFIISNGGISRADNVHLALNLVAGEDGVIAFDEYHQGRGAAQNRLFAYFAGTPALALAGQLGLIVFLVVWARGRRFARPIPLPQVDRRSKLEFVASMAELQQRSRAYDLAIESIYTRTRRVLVRYAGADNKTGRAEIAARVSARSPKIDRQYLEWLMRECEEIINGQPVKSRQALALVARLREIERELGLRMRAREIKQAKEGSRA